MVISKKIIAVLNSIIGYNHEIFLLHARQRPLSIKNERTGTRSYHAIVREQCGQADRVNNDLSRRMRYANALRNEPQQRNSKNRHGSKR